MEKSRSEEVECCANCTHCVSIPKNNRYGDIEHFCLVTGYFLHGIKKDKNKVRRYTPGGGELKCRYERKNNTK